MSKRRSHQAEIEAVKMKKFQGQLIWQVAAFTAMAVTINPQTSIAFTLESSRLGSLSGLPGLVVGADQFLGWRFQLDAPLQVTDIGGHFYGFNSEIFGTIVSLSSPNAFPQENPSELEKVSLASTTFSIINNGNPNSSVFFLTPLSITLKPGNYALIFGSGLFGASGEEAMPVPENQIAFPNTSFFFADLSVDPNASGSFSWSELLPEPQGNEGDLYFTIRGNPISSVPEPSPIHSLLILSILGAGSVLLTKKQKN